jgi:hypothetical protein
MLSINRKPASVTSACHDGEASGPEGRRRQWGRSGRADCSVEGEGALASNGGGSREDGRRCETPRGRPAARTAREEEPGPEWRGRTAAEEGEEVPTSDGGRISGWWRWGPGTM